MVMWIWTSPPKVFFFLKSFCYCCQTSTAPWHKKKKSLKSHRSLKSLVLHIYLNLSPILLLTLTFILSHSLARPLSLSHTHIHTGTHTHNSHLCSSIINFYKHFIGTTFSYLPTQPFHLSRPAIVHVCCHSARWFGTVAVHLLSNSSAEQRSALTGLVIHF